MSYEKAIKCLEEIQENSLIERYGTNYIKEHADFLQRAEQKIGDVDIKQPKFLMTKYENPQMFILLDIIFQKVEKASVKLKYHIPKTPFIGTAYSKEFNAIATNVPGTEDNLIVFEAELFVLCNLLAKIIVSCLPDFRIEEEEVCFNFQKEKIENHIVQYPIITERFKDFIINAIQLGQPIKTNQYHLNNEVSTRFHFELLNSLEVFIVGHEYGHIYAGHLENNLFKSLAINKKEFQIITTDWQMEFDADQIGLNLLLNTDEINDFFPFSILGPELFFTFLDIYDRAISLSNYGCEISSIGCESHPPSNDRRKRIRNNLNNLLPETHLDSYQVASGFLEDVMEILWDNYKKNSS